MRRAMGATWIAAVVVLSACDGSTADTCGGLAPSATPVVAVTAPAGAATEGTLSVSFDEDLELPAAYFAGATLVTSAGITSLDPSDPEVASVGAAGRTLTLTIDPYADAVARGSLTATVLLPDPRTLDLCTHPGQPDRYYVSVQVSFDAAGAPTATVAHELIRGAI